MTAPTNTFLFDERWLDLTNGFLVGFAHDEDGQTLAEIRVFRPGEPVGDLVATGSWATLVSFGEVFPSVLLDAITDWTTAGADPVGHPLGDGWMIRPDWPDFRTKMQRQAQAQRRVWEMRQTTADLWAATGEEPAMRDVLDATNARLSVHHDDLNAAGLKCTADDYDRVVTPSEFTPSDPSEMEATRRLLIARIVDECHASHPDTGRAAEIFFAQTTSQNEPVDESVVAAATGMDIWDAVSHVEGIKTIARRVTHEHFGIVQHPRRRRR